MSMIRSCKVEGASACLRNMIREGRASGEKIGRGLKVAGAFLLKESQKQVPVDIGNLKASGFVRAEGSGSKTRVKVGYTAKYAIYVHENMEAAHGVQFNEKHQADIDEGRENVRGFGQKAKFLEDPYKENLQTLMYIIMKEVMRDNNSRK